MRNSESSYVSCSEREKKEGEKKKGRQRERKGKKNPRPPEIVFYVTWLAADVIASD